MSMGSPFWKDVEYVDVGLEMDGYVYMHTYMRHSLGGGVWNRPCGGGASTVLGYGNST